MLAVQIINYFVTKADQHQPVWIKLAQLCCIVCSEDKTNSKRRDQILAMLATDHCLPASIKHDLTANTPHVLNRLCALQMAAKKDSNRRDQILAMLAAAFPPIPPQLPGPPSRQLAPGPEASHQDQDFDSNYESSSCTDIPPSLSIPDSERVGLRSRSLMSLLQVRISNEQHIISCACSRYSASTRSGAWPQIFHFTERLTASIPRPV